MPTDTSPPRILAAAAAAVIFKDDLPPSEEGDSSEESQTRFAVHPHIEPVEDDDPVLLGYLDAIYSKSVSVASEYPASGDFKDLTEKAKVESATRGLAERLAESMAHKNASRGIVFGCLFETADGILSHGIVKVDLDDARRFHFSRKPGKAWSLREVRDILPPPKRHFAKFIIAPQPNGDGAVGVRDEYSSRESAAEYVLEAFEITVPKTSGTKARVGSAALRGGETIERVHEVLGRITQDAPTEDVLSEFGEATQQQAERVRGTAHRPMPTVVAADEYKRVYRSSDPYLLVEAGPEVLIEREGARRLIIELPQTSEITTEIR